MAAEVLERAGSYSSYNEVRERLRGQQQLAAFPHSASSLSADSDGCSRICCC